MGGNLRVYGHCVYSLLGGVAFGGDDEVGHVAVRFAFHDPLHAVRGDHKEIGV